MISRKRPRPDWLSWLLASSGALSAIGFFAIYVPRPTTFERFFAHLAHAKVQLPWSVRFALDRTAWAAVLGVALVALVAGLRTVSSRRRWLLGTSAALSFGAVVLGFVGLGTADRTCVFPAARGLRRCVCPDNALECHCTREGAVRERFLSGRALEHTAIGDRLFGGRSVEGVTVRATPILEGAAELGWTFTAGEASAVCLHPAPCLGDRCGPCSVDEHRSPLYSIRDGLRCVDLRAGERFLLDGTFLHLRRTVWRAGTTTVLPADLAEDARLATESSELVGRMGNFGDATLEDIVVGAGRAPTMRTGGIRECLTTASGLLARDLEPPLPPSAAMVVRLEMVAD
jgi:hypothetical protein